MPANQSRSTENIVRAGISLKKNIQGRVGEPWLSLEGVDDID